MKVTVYCSSRDNLDDKYVETAIATAQVIGKSGAELVYGGVNAGLMHILAQSAVDNGAEVTGIVPQCFENRADTILSHKYIAETLSSRKQQMIELGDVFVVLPGGLGTIDEWMSTLTHLEITHDEQRKIIVVNIDGEYDAILQQLTDTSISQFARSPYFLGINRVVRSVEKLRKVLTEIIQEKNGKE